MSFAGGRPGDTMLGFVRIFGLVGLPLFLVVSLYLWKPNRPRKGSESPVAVRVAWTVLAVALSFYLCFPLIFLPLVILAVWKPEARPVVTADRLAWTVFILGVCLMITMALYALTQEGDGSWRSWETIQRHTRIFLALAVVPLSGPLVAYLMKRRTSRIDGVPKKPSPLDDDW